MKTTKKTTMKSKMKMKMVRGHAVSAATLDWLVQQFLPGPEQGGTGGMAVMAGVERAHWHYIDFCIPEEERRRLGENLELAFTLEEFAGQLLARAAWLRQLVAGVAGLVAEYDRFKRRLPACGAIVLNTALDKVLLVRSYWAGSWGFPKGKVEEGEAAMACAAREVEEETGLEVGRRLHPAEYLEARAGGRRVRLYMVPNQLDPRGVEEATELVASTRCEIGAIKWESLATLATTAGRRSLAALLLPQILAWVEAFSRDHPPLATSRLMEEEETMARTPLPNPEVMVRGGAVEKAMTVTIDSTVTITTLMGSRLAGKMRSLDLASQLLQLETVQGELCTIDLSLVSRVDLVHLEGEQVGLGSGPPRPQLPPRAARRQAALLPPSYLPRAWAQFTLDTEDLLGVVGELEGGAKRVATDVTDVKDLSKTKEEDMPGRGGMRRRGPPTRG